MNRNCPHCNAEMFEEYDHINRVRVLVCSRPTCLFRIYPDYPRRKGNEEVCYGCQTIFKVRQNDAGVLCPECKAKVEKNKNTPVNGTRKQQSNASHLGTHYSTTHKTKVRHAV